MNSIDRNMGTSDLYRLIAPVLPATCQEVARKLRVPFSQACWAFIKLRKANVICPVDPAEAQNQASTCETPYQSAYGSLLTADEAAALMEREIASYLYLNWTALPASVSRFAHLKELSVREAERNLSVLEDFGVVRSTRAGCADTIYHVHLVPRTFDMMASKGIHFFDWSENKPTVFAPNFVFDTVGSDENGTHECGQSEQEWTTLDEMFPPLYVPIQLRRPDQLVIEGHTAELTEAVRPSVELTAEFETRSSTVFVSTAPQTIEVIRLVSLSLATQWRTFPGLTP